MKKFSFHRYLLTLRLQLAADWKRQVIFTVIIALFLFIALGAINWFAYQFYIALPENQAMVHKGISSYLKILFVLNFLSLAIGYNSAHSMPFMKNRTAHIAHLVLPATTVEKYAVAQTRAFLLSIVEYLFAFLLADLLLYLMTDISTLGDYAAMDWNYFAQTGAPVQGVESLLSTSIGLSFSVTLLYSAWFTFCATAFRKYPFLFGLLILLGLQQVLTVASFFPFGLIGDFFNWMSGQFSGMSDNQVMGQISTMMGWGIAGIILLAIIFWVISYFRMKKVEL